ncbi:MAG: elongation factor Ts, partial [Nitrospiraceae bacterium]|nr:elongation factor Ts [Nitrospiraceae bacterium]
VIEREREILTNEAKTEGKPEAIIGRIVDGKISKFFSENCLLEQPWIKDDKKTVAELIKENISKLGENIKIKNFCRFEVGR